MVKIKALLNTVKRDCHLIRLNEIKNASHMLRLKVRALHFTDL